METKTLSDDRRLQIENLVYGFWEDGITTPYTDVEQLGTDATEFDLECAQEIYLELLDDEDGKLCGGSCNGIMWQNLTDDDGSYQCEQCGTILEQASKKA